MFDKEKFKALVQHVCASVEDPASLGAVKLNKILWFSDVNAFQAFGRSITGATYAKQKFGPVPRAMPPVLRELTDEGKIRIDEVEYFGKTKKHYVSLSAPDLSKFGKDELAIIDEIIKLICNNFTATSISNATHDDIWKLAEIGEDIPLEATLGSALDLISPADVEWIKQRQLHQAQKAA